MKTTSALRLAAFLAVLGPAWWTAEQAGPRFRTDRESPVRLELPDEDESFVFAVFGDRTGGPAEGVEVLAQAVEEVNLVDPDLVMTVGDLIQGYNGRDAWQRQADEFTGIMDRLDSPWFPVAGNHDTYWRGDGRPDDEHDSDYERHFGPLWYAFRHKGCWFISLYSDEGNPVTGEKDFNKPECQVMSAEQFAFLDRTLEEARDARHVFVFLHHPRWNRGRYGDDWQRVHERLVEAGNVTAVFAGHIHRMVYDGARDGIEYFTLATVGGHQLGDAPEAGFLHHWNLVTVRDGGIAMSAFPVGAALDPRLVTKEVSDAARTLIDTVQPVFSGVPTLLADAPVRGRVRIELTNPLARAVDANLHLSSADARWTFAPDHLHEELPPGATRSFEFEVERPAGGLDEGFATPELELQIDHLAETHRVRIPARRFPVPLDLGQLPEPPAPEREVALDLDGRGDALAVPHELLDLPDGPFTVECWFQGDRFGERVGLVNKTEGCEFGFFLNRGVPRFLVHLDGGYVEVASARTVQPGEWHHIAGVFDGEEVRLYLDGQLEGSAAASGSRTRRAVPLLVGADVDGSGGANSFFDGRVDEVRVSDGARYTQRSWRPRRRFEPDETTRLLLHCDGTLGAWTLDSSGQARHARLRGTPRPTPVD
jgi:3',5'-cyclic AMP phosphodiesterase CpdA